MWMTCCGDGTGDGFALSSFTSLSAALTCFHVYALDAVTLRIYSWMHSTVNWDTSNWVLFFFCFSTILVKCLLKTRLLSTGWMLGLQLCYLNTCNGITASPSSAICLFGTRLFAGIKLWIVKVSSLEMLAAQDTIKDGHFQAKMSWPTAGYSGQAISRNIKV